MARKSNKTAHVLNLLSGHDTKKEPEKELETDVKKDADPISEQDSQPKDAQQPHPDPEPTEKIPRGKISVPDSPSVSIIDQTEKDPVAELPTQESEPSAEPEATAEAETNAAVEPELTIEAEPVAEPESPIVSAPEPEPEFVRINVMERIVSDKIIYFMRQFECCTCEKCIADTIALTLNGLPPKYIVTEPAAEAPLLSFYTNHFISEITVEATKACMTVKENPRHKNGAS